MFYVLLDKEKIKVSNRISLRFLNSDATSFKMKTEFLEDK